MSTPPMIRVVEREALVFRAMWKSVTIWNLVTPLMYLGAMGLGLGGLVDSKSGGVSGLTYLEFVTPGLMAASAAMAAAGESLWPIMLGTKWQRHFHATVASPITAADLYGGVVLWITIRAAVSMAAFLAVAALLGGVPSAWGVLAVPAAVLGALALAAPLAAFAATQDNDVPFSMIMRLGILPLFLFSGTFFPISQLPGWIQPLAQLSPLYHAVELCRSATTGDPSGAGFVHVTVLLACVASGVWWGTRTFTRKLAA